MKSIEIMQSSWLSLRFVLEYTLRVASNCISFTTDFHVVSCPTWKFVLEYDMKALDSLILFYYCYYFFFRMIYSTIREMFTITLLQAWICISRFDLIF